MFSAQPLLQDVPHVLSYTRRLARRFARSTDAEDLAQEVMLRWIQHRTQRPETSPSRIWLTCVMRHCYGNMRRKASIRANVMEHGADVENLGMEDEGRAQAMLRDEIAGSQDAAIKIIGDLRLRRAYRNVCRQWQVKELFPDLVRYMVTAQVEDREFCAEAYGGKFGSAVDVDNTFRTFMVHGRNRAAYDAIRSRISGATKTRAVLCICAETGQGKTHLLQAAFQAAPKNRVRALYITGQDLISQARKAPGQLLDLCHKTHVILIDDLHYVAESRVQQDNVVTLLGSLGSPHIVMAGRRTIYASKLFTHLHSLRSCQEVALSNDSITDAGLGAIQEDSGMCHAPSLQGEDVRHLQSDMLHCIQRLPSMERSVMLADLVAGGRAQTNHIVANLNTTASSVYVSRARARKKVRAALEALGYRGVGRNPTAMGRANSQDISA